MKQALGKVTAHIEIILATLLGVTAILTAFAGYKASLDDGDSVRGYSQSTTLSDQASQAWTQGNQEAATDRGLFLAYAEAAQTGKDAYAAYIKQSLMSPNLRKAVTWWERTDTSQTPFDEASPYTNTSFADGKDLDEQALAAYTAGQAYDDRGDAFTLTTVFMAVALFFFGIAALFRTDRMRLFATGAGIVVLVLGCIQLVQAMSISV